MTLNALIIVSGQIRVAPKDVGKYLAASTDAIRQARETDGCRDFVVAADPI